MFRSTGARRKSCGEGNCVSGPSPTMAGYPHLPYGLIMRPSHDPYQQSSWCVGKCDAHLWREKEGRIGWAQAADTPFLFLSYTSLKLHPPLEQQPRRGNFSRLSLGIWRQKASLAYYLCAGLLFIAQEHKFLKRLATHTQDCLSLLMQVYIFQNVASKEIH